MKYYNRNDTYLRKHLERLIGQHGGKWIVISNGRPVGIGTKKMMKRFFEIARKKNPKETPLVSPIPTREQLHCILSSFHTKK